MQRVSREWVRVLPKSVRGRRWVPLSPATVAMLRQHRIEQNERRLLLGKAFHAAFTLQTYYHTSEATAAPLAASIDDALGAALDGV